MRSIIRFFRKELTRIFVGLSLFILALILDALSLPTVPLILYVLALLVSGMDVFISAVRGILRLDFFDEKFLMTVASVGAMIIGEPAEGVAVMLFFLVGEYFEHRATGRARASIRSLMEICPDTARVKLGDDEVLTDAEDVEIGSLIIIRPGERVPIDATVISGECEVDTSALTGEAVPRPLTVGDSVYSGSVVLGGSIVARTERLAEQSRAARILELVSEASDRKSREESFITKFSRYYTPAVTALALLMAVIPPMLSLLGWTESVYRALSFLVVSCPCALVISVPMAFFGGIGHSATLGVLYKGGNVFSPVSHLSRVVFDKTGTLTTGEFAIKEIITDMDREELLSLVAAAEHNSNHPIAECLKNASHAQLTADKLTDIPGKGVIAEVAGRSVAVGNIGLMEHVGAACDNIPAADVYVAIDGVHRASLMLTDTVKPEAARAIEELRRLGVKHTVILSGDRSESTHSVARELGIDEAHGDLLPEDKYSLLEAMLDKGGTLAYVGDGINDSPCLARADVGIAMGERGSDSAIESSDLVIMSDDLSRIPEAVRTARKTIRIAKQNIVFAIGIKLAVLALVAFDLAGMWLAVFADVGVAVIAILNSMRTMLKSKKR